MKKKSSRLPGFYKLSVEERLKIIAEALGEHANELKSIFEGGGMSLLEADKLVENVLGVTALPFSIAANFLIDGEDTLVPMAVEEPSVVAAASNAAKIIRAGGGFITEACEPIMIAQIQLFADDIEAAAKAILENCDEILHTAARADEPLLRAGGGPKELEIRRISSSEGRKAYLVIHLIVDVRDAMGANAVNTMAETVAPLIERITGGRTGLKILSNLADRRLVRVFARAPRDELKGEKWSGEEMRDRIVEASLFAEEDIYRAATHNKGIMNGVDAVVMAAMNDWRAVEAGAHAYAAKDGRYRPLAVWRRGEAGDLEGRLEMPLAVGIVGGAARVSKAAKTAIKIMGADSAVKLAKVAACAGLASNLAALKALASEGIQRGHMRLHKRSGEVGSSE